jgi:hypothetical protein
MAGFSSILALTLAGAGTAFSAVNQIRAGRAQQRAFQRQGEGEERAGLAAQRAAESQAALAEFNAAVADLQAKDALARGELDANRFRQRVKVLVGEQRAGIAAGNVDVGYGSAVDVQADTAFQGELDALTVKTNAAREAWGYRVEAEDIRQRARIARQEGEFAAESGRLAREAGFEQGKAARSSANWGAAGSILSTGSQLVMARYGFSRGGGG